MLRVLVVDDEELARERLVQLLKPYDDVAVVGQAGDGEEALEKIVSLGPDVVFLDIQMPGCSGLEVAASMPTGKSKIIFCTAYDQYAIEAFEVNAVDYLLKPVSRQRLARALERVHKGVASPSDAVEKVVKSAGPLRFLAKHANRYAVVAQREVLYFSSEGGLTKLQTREHSYWMEPSLNQLEERLQSWGFCRISRQVLVNLEAVRQVAPLTGGYGNVRLENGTELEVSRRRLKELISRLEGELGE